MDGVTALLRAIRAGTPGATHRLIEAVHSELHRMAQGKMLAERPGHTLQTTALVNEAYLRLLGPEGCPEDQAHFFGAASKAMERVLVDHVRRKRAQKRGGDAMPITFRDLDVESPGGDVDVLEIHDAIEVLERESPDLASLVRYRYFIGLTLEQIAQIDETSLATVKRRWTFARAWLYDHLDW